MHNSKFFEIIAGLDARLFKKLGLFINSPYHNSNRNLIKLYEMIKSGYPQLNTAKLNKENVFSVLYPGREFDDVTIRGLSSDMLGVCEKFLAVENFLHSSALYEPILLADLVAKGSYSLAEKQIRKFRAGLKDSAPRNLTILSNMLTQIAVSNYYASKDDIMNYLNSRLDFIEFVYEYFTFQVLSAERQFYSKRFVSTVDINKSLLGNKMKHVNFAGIVKSLEERRSANYPVISFYFYANSYLENTKNTEALSNLKKIYYAFFDRLEKVEKSGWITIYSNVLLCSIRENATEKVRNELFKVYESYLDEELFVINQNHIPAETFISIWFNAAELKRFKWCAMFVKEHADNVNPGLKKEVLSVFEAFTNFYKGDFKSSLQVISKFTSSEKLFMIKIKQLETMIYFELNDWSSFEYASDRFNKFIINNFNPGDLRFQLYGNFMKTLKKITKSILSEDKAKIALVEKKLNREVYIDSREWLVEKLNEMPELLN